MIRLILTLMMISAVSFSAKGDDPCESLVTSAMLIQDLVHLAHPNQELAESLLEGKDHPLFRAANDPARLSIPGPKLNLSSVSRTVADLLKQKPADFLKMSRQHVHIRNTWSVVLADLEHLMIRMYVIRPEPGQRHASHYDWSLPFLIHTHRYHFWSAALAGRVINQRYYAKTNAPNQEEFWDHSFQSQITNGKASIEPTEKITLLKAPTEDLAPGEIYSMHANELHRVGFLGDSGPRGEDGWSIVLFFEYRDVAGAEAHTVWHNPLHDIPESDGLYQVPQPMELERLRLDIIQRLEGRP